MGAGSAARGDCSRCACTRRREHAASVDSARAAASYRTGGSAAESRGATGRARGGTLVGTPERSGNGDADSRRARSNRGSRACASRSAARRP